MGDQPQEWGNAGETNFSFLYAGETSVDEVADDGINAIIFKDEQCPGNCSVATYYHENNGIFKGFDIVFYSIAGGSGYPMYWSIKVTPFPWDADLITWSLHEFGHALGLDHSQYPGTVMNMGGGTGGARRELQWDDIDGIQALYNTYDHQGFWASEGLVEEGHSFTLHLDYELAADKPFVVLMTTVDMDGTPLYLYHPSDSRMLAIDDDFFPMENYPEVFVNMDSNLDSNGRATATVHLPSDAINQFGEHLYFTAVTIDCQYLNCYEDVGVGVHVQIEEGFPDPTPTPHFRIDRLPFLAVDRP